MKLEISIENTYVQRAAGYGVDAVKFKVAGRRNFPDRLNLCGNGYCFFIEFKRTAKHEPRRAQLSNHRKLRRMGYHVFVCWTVEDAVDILETELMNCV